MFKKIFHSQLFFFLALLSMGINFCFTFELANLSSFFRFLGASSHDLPFLWLAPPLTGLIVQPIIGQLSDDTTTRFGKRRPYILVWGILASFFLCVIPTIHTFILVVAAIWIIDSSLNGSIEGLRALTCDLATTESDRTKAFAVQAYLGGIGGALGTGMPFIIHKLLLYWGIETSATAVPLNIKISYFICGIILITTILITLRYVKEKPNKFIQLYKKRKQPKTFYFRVKKIFTDLYKNFVNSPLPFKKICFIHSIAWMGIFIFWLHFTTNLAQNKYGISPLGDPNDPHYIELLQRATLDSATYLSIYQYVSIAYGLLLFFISSKFNLKLLHAVGLGLGGISMAMLSFSHTHIGIIICMMGIGIMWGSILVLPYSIAMLHIPKGKRGIYLGIFNISITAPQLLISLLLPFIFKYFLHSDATYLMLIAGGLLIVSSSLWFSYKPIKIKPVTLSVDMAN